MEVLASAAEFVLTISQKDWNPRHFMELLSSPKILCGTFVFNQDTFGTFVFNEGSRGALSQGQLGSPSNFGRPILSNPPLSPPQAQIKLSSYKLGCTGLGLGLGLGLQALLIFARSRLNQKAAPSFLFVKYVCFGCDIYTLFFVT
eukprot:scaffold40100_cov250-Skeletonema_dohrnii-CCMP3373.AAC.1